MLYLFRRPDTPEDFFELHSIPVDIALAAGFSSNGGAQLWKKKHVGCCRRGLGNLALHCRYDGGNGRHGRGRNEASVALFEQVGLSGGFGAAVGASVASKVGPTELPQTVTAFHSLVGSGAMTAVAGEILGGGSTNGDPMAVGSLAAIFMATWIGDITTFLNLSSRLGNWRA